jgi:hypothetical protein
LYRAHPPTVICADAELYRPLGQRKRSQPERWVVDAFGPAPSTQPDVAQYMRNALWAMHASERARCLMLKERDENSDVYLVGLSDLNIEHLQTGRALYFCGNDLSLTGRHFLIARERDNDHLHMLHEHFAERDPRILYMICFRGIDLDALRHAPVRINGAAVGVDGSLLFFHCSAEKELLAARELVAPSSGSADATTGLWRELRADLNASAAMANKMPSAILKGRGRSSASIDLITRCIREVELFDKAADGLL